MSPDERRALVREIAEKLRPIKSVHEAMWISVFAFSKGVGQARERAFGIVERRLKGEPLAYILGGWAFREHEFAVGPGALIPRAETE